ncbi:hypothetical protein Poly51_51370 [Rubripirellula tenax]|uniref:DUF1552 domain-containing protein n=1 Tax=Rubripirellula tenax TaxID=2528015 RepID=A0A5C6EH23_9BACT|nr:DUF1552 domain-containing protein [Rubripirellula tenax]TWU47337.1 hypothetical protein Poly51_51370 [Rubripirellula tenax]
MSSVFSRRTVLRGLGAAVALPWLEAMHRTTAIAATPGKPPVRLGYFYVPNGVHMPQWRPDPVHEDADRTDFDRPLSALPDILRPLETERVADRVVVVSNLEAKHCFAKGAGHEPAGGGFLVGAHCKHSEEPEVGGISVDQLAARKIGIRTPIDSLALGIDPGHRGDHGFSGTYLSHISWRSRTTPATLELNPKELFARLFRDSKPKSPNWNVPPAPESIVDIDPVRGSILDLIQEDTRSLQRQLGFADQRRLEEYLDGLRSIERRIATHVDDPTSHHETSFNEDPANRALHEGESADNLPELVMPDGRGIPSEYAEHVDLMLDILTMAFRTDTTRVASFMFSFEKSGRSYPEIKAPGSHHSTSHHQGDAAKHAELVRINSHHMALFAGMLNRMSQINEGDSTLLDNVAFLYGSGISDGNKHNHDDLPVLVAGGGGGRFRGGRHLSLSKPTPICNVYLEMLRAAGIDRDSFGDSTDGFSKLT